MADDSFKAFVLDQLSALPGMRAKAMFGGHGLYSEDKFFGILDEGRVFFKTNDATRGEYTMRGMEPFTYTMKGKTMTMAYHEVPPDVLEQPHELILWARQAIALAAAKTASRARPSPGAATLASQRRPKIEKTHFWQNIAAAGDGRLPQVVTAKTKKPAAKKSKS